MVFTLFVLDWKYSFWTNLVQKIKIVSLSWNLEVTLIRICRIQWWYSLFSFLTGDTLFGKLGLKIQNFQFKLKFGVYNPGQGIWSRMGRYSESGQGKKSLTSTFACFLTAIASLISARRAGRCAPPRFEIFFIFPYFLIFKVLSCSAMRIPSFLY